MFRVGGGQAPESWNLIGRREQVLVLKVYCGWPSGSGAMDFDRKAYRKQQSSVLKVLCGRWPGLRIMEFDWKTHKASNSAFFQGHQHGAGLTTLKKHMKPYVYECFHGPSVDVARAPGWVVVGGGVGWNGGDRAGSARVGASDKTKHAQRQKGNPL